MPQSQQNGIMQYLCGQYLGDTLPVWF